MRALWWWIDRWRKSTAYMDLTLEEQGAYRNLLDEANLRGGAIPNDERVLAKACGDALAWTRVKTNVMARFELHEDGWHNATLDDVLDQSRRRAEKQARYRHRLGNAGGNGTGNAGGSPSPSPSPSPDPEPEPEPIRKSVGVEDAPSARPSDLADAWNNVTTPPIPRCRLPLNVTRHRKAKARLGEYDLEQWREIFATIEQSAFCRGANDRGWVASFDWVLQADTGAKVLEGKYNNRASGQKTAGNIAAAQRWLQGGDHDGQ